MTDMRPSARIVADLAATLTKLRLARVQGHDATICVAETRLNWLIDQLPRKKP